MNENIFINIASFRDPSLAITIKSALHHADKPENLIFGVGAQYYDGEMPRLDVDKSQLRLISYNPDTRPGVVRIRYEISKLLKDEKYFYMIDSHTLFSPGWDTKAIAYLNEAKIESKSNEVILSGCGSKENIDYIENSKYFLEKRNDDGSDAEGGYLAFVSSDFPIPKTKNLTKHFHIDFSNFFTTSNFLSEVELDPISDFLFEEAYISWRAFMSGWDVYVPENGYAFQNPHAYFNIVWDNDWQKRDYLREEDKEKDNKLIVEIFEAFVFNDSSSRFSVKNPKRSTSDFWEWSKPDHIDYNVIDRAKTAKIFGHRAQ